MNSNSNVYERLSQPIPLDIGRNKNSGKAMSRTGRTDRARATEDALRRIDLDIIGGRLRAVIDEMATIIVRTSMSPLVKDVLDFVCCICDRSGNLISQNNGITVLTGTVSRQLSSIRAKFSSTIRAGDIYITNDPFEGNTHTADVTLVKPVFIDGALLCFVTVTAHWTDIGGRVAGSLSPDAQEIYEEGLRIPALRIVREGIPQDELIEMILANVRMPAMTGADLSSQLAVVRVGEARIRDLIESYGSDLIAASFEHSLRLGEAMSRAAIATLPKGVYFARETIDFNGPAPVPIHVRVAIRGDDILVDFAGSGPQQKGPINCTRGALEAAARAALVSVLEPGAFLNDGWFKPIEVAAPDGTILTAAAPAATGWCYESMSRVVDLVCKALAPVAPDRVSAGSYTSLCTAYLGGHDADGQVRFVLAEPHIGGWGASDGNDGTSALIAACDGDTYNHPVEIFEANYPIRVNRYALNPASAAGAGRFRGGLGVVREYEMLDDGLFFFTNIGRSGEQPWAIEDGEPGSVNYFEMETSEGMLRGATISLKDLARGDLIRICTGNGGGFGDPRERDAARVLADVENGYLDRADVADIYGVVLGDAPDNHLYVDEMATRHLREAGSALGAGC